MSLLSSLRRPIDPKKHVREVDGLRLLAIGTVVVAHIVPSVASRYSAVTDDPLHGDIIRGMFSDGRRGVVLFFVISGFVLGLPFLRAADAHKNISTRAYFLRRLTRLEPPYLISLSLMLIGDIILLREPLGDLLPHFLAGLPYLHTLIFDERNPINSVNWSLEVEVQFYVLMPLLAIVLARNSSRRRAILVTGIVVSLLLQALPFTTETLRWTETLAGSAHAFLAGVLIADLYLRGRWHEVPPTPLGDAAFVLGLTAFVLLPILTHQPLDPALVLGACLLLMFGALRGTHARAFHRRPVVWTVGGMCYSIYLLHLQLIRIVWRGTQPFIDGNGPPFVVALALQLAIMVPIVLVISGLFFLLVELPCMRWSQRVAARTRARDDQREPSSVGVERTSRSEDRSHPAQRDRPHAADEHS